MATLLALHKSWLSLTCLFIYQLAIAQSPTPRPVPNAYPSDYPLNYVRVWDVIAPVTNTANLNMMGSPTVAKTTTQYLDGLGRSVQTVAKEVSFNTGGNPKDLVSAIEYDEFGREQFKYLPFAASSSGNNNGLFKTDPFQQQQSFMQNQYGSQGESFFYGQTVFEASPLNRPVKILAPGDSWVGAANGGRGIANKYWLNTIADDVKIWKKKGYHLKIDVTNSGNGYQQVSYDFYDLQPSNNTKLLLYRPSGTTGNWTIVTVNPTQSPYVATLPVGAYEYAIQIWLDQNNSNWYYPDYSSTESFTINGIYPAGTLLKMVREDEHGSQVIEFKDKQNRLVLKKTQLSTAPGIADDGTGRNYSGWISVYYVYDDFGLLRQVIQPVGVELLLANNWDITALNGSILAEQFFRYQYDTKNRLIIKKAPGKGEVWMVYDKRERLVMSQDANQRILGKWLVTKYDDLNRIIETGLWVNSDGREQHAIAAAALDNYPNITVGYEMLTEIHYDNYIGLPTGFSSALQTPWASFPFYTVYNTAPLYAQELLVSSATTGLVTWVKTKVLGSSGQYLTSLTLYDNKNRPIQVQKQNISGGIDINTTQYDFSGKMLIDHLRHQLISSSNTQTTELVSRPNYDILGRLVKSEKMINSGAWRTVAELEYDALGYVKTKKLGRKLDAQGNETSAPIEALIYDSNIRGWQLGTNKDFLKDANASGFSPHYFGFELAYDKTQPVSSGTLFSSPQYNGNISGMVWKSTGDGVRRKYDLYYDGVNRFQKGEFIQNTSQNASGIWNTSEADFSVGGLAANGGMEYDANGNILSMVQKGIKGVTPNALIDQLHYSYFNASNKLQKVIDDNNDENSVLGDFKYAPVNKSASTYNDYGYDLNGNLVTDLNKKIGTSAATGVDITNGGSIQYNHLNLPQFITVQAKGTISYLYDAGGNKLRKTVVEDPSTANNNTQTTTVTTYIGGFVYEAKTTVVNSTTTNLYTDKLQFLSHEEGRTRPTTSTTQPWVFDYFLKDHLGNIRMVLTDEQKLDQYEPLTFEDQNINQQNDQWDNRSGQSINVATVRTQVNMTGGGTQTNAMLVRRSTGSIGATKLLKVMAGDKLHTSLDYHYTNQNAEFFPGNPINSMITSLVNSLSGSSVVSGTIHNQASAIGTLLQGNNDLATALLTLPNTSSTNPIHTAPAAYLCVLFFDEQFKYDPISSRVFPIAAGSTSATMQLFGADAVQVGKNGYAYLYFTNESDELVYFDNFNLTHERGPIIEETHYYPFGLTMAGISSKAGAFGDPENKRNKFQNQEFNDDLGVDMYEFKYRMDDPQIGRFWQVDPLCDSFRYNSTYAFSENKVTSHIELEGLETLESISAHVWRSGGITSTTGDNVVRGVNGAIEKAANVSKDVFVIAAGVTILVASAGTATPLFIGLSASAAVAGGTMKLAFDLSGHPELAQQVSTTVIGATMSAVNSATGKEVFNKDVKVLAEMSEGVLTFNVKGLYNMTNLQQISTGVSGVSLTLDALSPDLTNAMKKLYDQTILSHNNWQSNYKDQLKVKEPVVVPH